MTRVGDTVVHPEGAPWFAHAGAVSCPHCEKTTSTSPSPVVPGAGVLLPAAGGEGDFSDLVSGGTRVSRPFGPARPRLVSAALAALFLFTLAGCATLQPGQDAIVVRTEQALKASTPIYDAGMTWCEQNAAKLSPAALKLANAIRVDFPPAYRAVDSALQLYKAGKGGDPLGQLAELERLTRELLTLVQLAGGPDLTTGGAK